MKIEIEKMPDEYGGWTWIVRCDDRWEELVAGEVIETIARLVLMGPDAKTYLRTHEQHDAERKRWEEKYSQSPTPREAMLLAMDQDEENFPTTKTFTAGQ